MLSEEECLNLFRRISWSNGVVCPRCDSKNVIRLVGIVVDKGGYLMMRLGVIHYSWFSLMTWILITVFSMIIKVD